MPYLDIQLLDTRLTAAADLRHAERGALAHELAALKAGAPVAIASANVGCISHLGGEAGIPVRHWIELIDERLSA